MGYAISPLRDSETYLRILTGLDEDNVQLILKQYNSESITYENSPGIYTFKDLSEVLPKGFLKKEFDIRSQIQPNNKNDTSSSINIECDNKILKTKLFVKHKINAMRFDEKPFFSTILGFSPYWDYKSHNDEVYLVKQL